MPKAAKVDDSHACPIPFHAVKQIVPPCEPSVLICKQPAARMGDQVGCGATINSGEDTVLIGGKPAAREGDSSSHGGRITTGCPTVFIGKPAQADKETSSKEECTCEGDPVNVANGQVYTSALDVRFPSPLAVNLVRSYSSENIAHKGLLGWGWHCFLDMAILIDADEIKFIDKEGRSLYFPKIEPGETFFNTPEKLTLSRSTDYLRITTRSAQFYTFFAPGKGTQGFLTELSNAKGKMQFFYKAGLISFIEDAKGNRYQLSYNKKSLLTNIVLESSPNRLNLRCYYYDRKGRLIFVKNEHKQAFYYSYDANNRLIKKTNRTGYGFFYEYDKQGRCIRTQGQDGMYSRAFSYFPSEQKTSVINSQGHKTIYHWNALNLVTRKINALGGEQEYHYDSKRNRVKEIDENGQTTSYRYDDQGRCRAKIDADNNREETRYQGRVIQESDPLGNSITKVYNAQNRLIQVSDFQGNHKKGYHAGEKIKSSHSYGGIVAREYDSRGKLLLERDIFGHETHYEYDIKGRRVSMRDRNGFQTRYKYDAEDRLIQTTNPVGGNRKIIYNAFGQKIEQQNENGHTIKYNYNLEGQLTALTNENGEQHQFQYDALNRLVFDQEFDGQHRTYTYDAVGNLIQVKESEGSVFNLSYDKLKRLVGVEGVEVNGSVIKNSYQYDRAGRLIAAQNAHSVVQFDYDELGRVIKETQGDFIVESSYNRAGNLASLETNWGLSVHFHYDDKGRLSEFVLPKERQVRYVWNALDRPIERHLPGGVFSRCDHDPLGKLVSQAIYNSEGLLIQRQYCYDATGKVIKLDDNRQGVKHYRYDKAGRLVQAIDDSQKIIEAFAYDAAGNPLNNSRLKNKSLKGNQVTSLKGNSYEYDGRGNLISKTDLEGTTHYRYNRFNQLIQVEKQDFRQIEYRYDAIGRRIAKVVDGNLTQFVWNQFQLIGEEQASKRIEYVFYPEHFIPLCHLEEDKAYFYQIDQLGTVREVTDDDGQLLWSGNYQAFGQCQVDNSARITNPLRFPGQYWDEETELHYNQFRYYDPQTGRYLTKDPISYLSGDFNLYRYGKNDPVNQSDVLGLKVMAVPFFYEAIIGGLGLLIAYFGGKAIVETVEIMSTDSCQGCSEMANEGEEGGATAEEGDGTTSENTNATHEESTPASPDPNEEPPQQEQRQKNKNQAIQKSKEYQKEAQEAAVRHQRQYGQDKTVASTGGNNNTLSGWETKSNAHTRKNFKSSVSPEKVSEYSKEIGHPLKSNPIPDQIRSGGFDGKFQASHAEKQQVLLNPNKPIGISKNRCPDCQLFFQRVAVQRNRSQIITDPIKTRIFYSDGTIEEISLPKLNN